MKIVLTTGCANSGWEIAIPPLQQAGLELVDDSFRRWHDELFQLTDVPDPLNISRPFQPDISMAKSAAALIPETLPVPLLLSDSRSLWLLDFWATQLPKMRFLLFYTRAETAMAYALLHRLDPQQFLNSWQAANQQLIHFQSRNRRRAILLDAEAASQQPHALVDACRRVGLTLQLSQKWSMPKLKLSLLDRLVGDHLVAATDSSIQTLCTELEARAQPLSDIKPALELQPEKLINSYRQQKASEQQLQRQLDEVNKKLEAAEQNRKDYVAEREQVQAQIVEAQQSAKALEVVNKENAQENELLLIQLQQVQGELEHYFLKYHELNRVRLAEDRVIEQSNQIETRTKQTLIWRITAPIRVLAKRLGRQTKTQKDVRLLKESGIFDEPWYLIEYPDVASAGVDPVEHYVEFGAKEGRNPSTSFDTQYYLESNPDVAVSGMNPLVHFVKFGRAEERKATA